MPQDEDLPSLEWYVLCDKLKPFEQDCVWERYASDQEMILNNAYKAYTVRGEGDGTVKLYPTRKTTWLIDFKDESNMTQLHCTTNRQRAVVTNQPDPVDLHYEDVGPPRRAYVPAWDNPSRTDTAHDGPLCLHFCEQKVWCSETFKVKPCGKPCTLIHEHHGLHNCGQHTALVDLGEFAPGYGGGLYGEGRPQWNPDVPREVREFAHQLERSARDIGIRLESPQPSPERVDSVERTTHVKSPDSETPPKDETKEFESDTEPVGRFPSDAQHWINQERGEDDHRAQEVHRAKREPPTPPMDTRRVQRARQEFQQQMQERQQKGHGKGAPTSAAEIDTDADDDSDDSWGTWRDTHERAGPPAPGAFQSGTWTDEGGYHNPYPQYQHVDDPHPGYRQTASGAWYPRRVPGERRRGKPRNAREAQEQQAARAARDARDNWLPDQAHDSSARGSNDHWGSELE